MKKYVQIVNEETKLCSVGTGTNTEFYKSIGMTEMDVEQAYDGNWYLVGYVPQKPDEKLAEEKRVERNRLLKDSDTRMLPDFPISEEEKKLWIDYRVYLRDLPEAANFPNVEVLSFDDWKVTIL